MSPLTVTNTDIWKQRYKHNWEESSEREAFVATLIEEQTTKKVQPVGLGAMTDEFISGTAKQHGFERGGADLRIVGTNIFIEVTGPLREGNEADPIWLRPDKLQSALRNLGKHRTWVVHCLGQQHLRAIALNRSFLDEVVQGKFRTTLVNLRGMLEAYIEIPTDHDAVKPWEWLVQWLREAE